MQHRKERVSEALREELTELIGYELSDPRVASAAVTGIEVSPDKRHALVRIRVDHGADAAQAIAALIEGRRIHRTVVSFFDLFNFLTHPEKPVPNFAVMARLPSSPC